MTGLIWMDWAILTISLVNTILLFWLGLMVLLNTDQRTWGVVLSSGALLMGGAFFFSHTAIVGYSPILSHPDIETWWRAGWIPITCLPFAWYAVMLWYSGYWEPDSPVQRRHRGWFRLTLVLAILFLTLLVFTHPLPTVNQIIKFDFSTVPGVYGIPVLILLYPLYTMLCTGLSLDVLRWPGPSRRVQAQEARQRAWPWLGAASLVLFLVSLLVGGTVFWVITSTRGNTYEPVMVIIVGVLDLLIASLITAAVLLLGQAIVAYEVFTGKSLPRRALQRSWRRIVILAGGYSPIASLAILLDFNPVIILLISALVITSFYALLSWRSFAEREHIINNLRPFLTSQDLFQNLVSQNGIHSRTPIQGQTIQTSFEALCADLLNAQLAYLVPLGSMAPLVGPTLSFPGSDPDDNPIKIDINLFAAAAKPSQTPLLPLNPDTYGGAVWGIPLIGRSGLIGALLLGEKRDHGLYTQEEIEISRLAGERLLDIQAGAEIARKLMALQRQRIAETRLLDQQTRRTLHDDILPQIHAAVLSLSEKSGEGDHSALIASLESLHQQVAAMLRELPPVPNQQIMQAGLAESLAQLVERDLRSEFDRVHFVITPTARQRIGEVSALSSEIVYYAAREAVRNAARYGRGNDSELELTLELQMDWQDGLTVSIRDNGVGIFHAADRASNGNSGQGLALHSTMLAVLGGTLEVFQAPEGGAAVTIRLPEANI